ncbi:MAG: DUF4474 domain-containing protein [Clostridia bacterium]|nr:DUF4474 domain-containing protein [Clostridia bacterium]
MKDIIKSASKRCTAFLCVLTLTVSFVFSGCVFNKKEESPEEPATQLQTTAPQRQMPVAKTAKSAAERATTRVSTTAKRKTATKTQKATTANHTEEYDFVSFFDSADELQQFVNNNRDKRLLKWYVDKDGYLTTEGDKGVLGFGYSFTENCFYATGNAWQRNFGYTKLYDKVSELMVISYDTLRIYFNYKGKDWMVQLWKGQYGFVLEGAEVGVYNRPEGVKVGTFYNCAKDNERLEISLSLYDKGRKLFTRKPQQSWWMTGFVPGQLGVGAGVGSLLTQLLTAKISITLKDEEMTEAFVEGLQNVTYIFNNVDYAFAVSNNWLINPGERKYSFEEGNGTSATRLKGTYWVEGNTVYLTWK